jgi:hypothetical protein
MLKVELSGEDIIGQELADHDFTTVMEEENFELLQSVIDGQFEDGSTVPESTRRALRQPFVMVRRDPAEFISSNIARGRPLTVAMFAVAYEQGPLRGLSGLHMCIYAAAGREEVYFHLANELLSGSLQRLIDVVGRPEVLRYDQGLVTAEAHRLRKLVDHPIMNIYYTGSVPRFRTTIMVKLDEEFEIGTLDGLLAVE